MKRRAAVCLYNCTCTCRIFDCRVLYKITDHLDHELPVSFDACSKMGQLSLNVTQTPQDISWAEESAPTLLRLNDEPIFDSASRMAVLFIRLNHFVCFASCQGIRS